MIYTYTQGQPNLQVQNLESLSFWFLEASFPSYIALFLLQINTWVTPFLVRNAWAGEHQLGAKKNCFILFLAYLVAVMSVTQASHCQVTLPKVRGCDGKRV